MDCAIIKFIDNRLDNYFSKYNIDEISPFHIKDLRDCILVEIIKSAYFESEEKLSLREHRGTDDDSVRMHDSRIMAYAQKYRNHQYKHVFEMTGKKIPELLPQDVQSMNEKLKGYKITKMQYFELKTMDNSPLLKAIINKRICDVKKISNSTFIEYMEEYDKLVNKLVSKLDGSDEEVIFGTLALYTLEWKYCIELFYLCAVEAEKHNTKEIPLERLKILCTELKTPIPTESRFVLHRLDLVSLIYDAPDELWEKTYFKLWNYFVVKYQIKEEISHDYSISDCFAKYTSRDKWATFFREHYNLRNMYVKKDWTNKRIRYVRNLIEVIFINTDISTK